MGHSIRELKALLAARGVDFSHCCERSELQQLLVEAEGCEAGASSSQPAAARHQEETSTGEVPAEPAGTTAAMELEQPQGGSPTAPAAAVAPAAAPAAAAAPVSDPVRGLSIRELKAGLEARRVDFSHCREKAELQELLRRALEQDSAPASQEELLPDGSFARRLLDDRLCWVEFVTDGDALCHWDDGTDAIVAAAELEHLAADVLPGPAAFAGSFEEARAEAFRRGCLLVAAVQGGGSVRTGAQKPEGLQNLVLASEEVATLLGENAVFWRGGARSLRSPHLQQLAPDGVPSLAMVLPLATDAMRVLSDSPGGCREAVVESFVAALDALESHKSMAEARLVSEAAQLRQEQDAEFAASLAADRELEEARRASLETAAAEAASAPSRGAGGREEASAAEEEAVVADGAKRPSLQQENEQQERLAKARRLLADEFLQQESSPPPGAATARLVLRLPSGERVQRTFGAQEPLSRVRRWAECCALLPEADGRSLQIPEAFDLATAFPQRTFGCGEAEQSLSELGLAPSAALLLIDRTQ